LDRLQLTEANPSAVLAKLAKRHQDLSDCYCEHPLEVDLQEEDIRKLVILSSILGGAEAIVLDRPVLAQMTGTAGSPAPQFCHFDSVRHVWLKPRNPGVAVTQRPDTRLPALDISQVRGYCEVLERYFRPTHWHSGRVAVALGAFLSYVLGTEPGQGYLALMTVFEALLSTDATEITHKISERVAFMLESSEDARFSLYKRMKNLYKTRSLLVHGAIENKKGLLTYDRLRLDAKMTIVPDQDYSDIFDLCTRLLRLVLKNAELLSLLETKNSALDDYYLRLGFRGSLPS
jgi:hypothetical protein